EPGAVQALNRREDVLEAGRAPTAHPQLSKARIPKRMREGRSALFENLFTVRDEQQAVSFQTTAKSGVVDCCHHRRAGASCGDQQVPVVPQGTRELDLLEQSLLERHEHDLDRAQLYRVTSLRQFGAATEL